MLRAGGYQASLSHSGRWDACDQSDSVSSGKHGSRPVLVASGSKTSSKAGNATIDVKLTSSRPSVAEARKAAEADRGRVVHAHGRQEGDQAAGGHVDRLSGQGRSPRAEGATERADGAGPAPLRAQRVWFGPSFTCRRLNSGSTRCILHTSLSGPRSICMSIRIVAWPRDPASSDARSRR